MASAALSAAKPDHELARPDMDEPCYLVPGPFIGGSVRPPGGPRIHSFGKFKSLGSLHVTEKSAVDHKCLSRYIRSVVRCQERDGCGHLFR